MNLLKFNLSHLLCFFVGVTSALHLRTSCPPIFQPCVMPWLNRARMSLLTKLSGLQKVDSGAQITILSRAHSVFFTALSLDQDTSHGRVHLFSNPNIPSIWQYREPLPSTIPELDVSRVKHKQPPTWRDRNPSNAVQPRKKTVIQSQIRSITAF